MNDRMLDLIGLSLEAIGVVVLAVLILRVHWRMLKEHKVNDPDVWREMKLEQKLGIFSIIIITIGFILQMISLG